MAAAERVVTKGVTTMLQLPLLLLLLRRMRMRRMRMMGDELILIMARPSAVPLLLICF